MRVRKDLCHAWVGWRHAGYGRACPACYQPHTVTLLFPVRNNNRDSTWTQPYHCQDCGFRFTLHFHSIDSTTWVADRFIMGVKREGT